jgi:caspase domain-containing protein
MPHDPKRGQTVGRRGLADAGEPSAEREGGRPVASKRALLVGIDLYPDPRNNLNSCVADTQRFRGLLQNFYGFQPQDITLVHNSAATLANVRIQLSQLFAGARSGDQVIFFQSSHGYRYVKGSTFIEVLCLYDQFLEDTELVQLSQQVPPGTFTCVLDACHSAGLEKLFFAPDGLHAARAKVWQPPPDQAAADVALLTQATSFKSFGHAATSDTGAVAKQFSAEAFAGHSAPPAKAGEGQPELNGVLFAACLADQTAAAGSAPTDGLSAFTWALGRQLEAGGVTIAANALRDRVAQDLQALNMRQTPTIEAPMAHGGWLTQTLITYGAPTGAATTPTPQPTPTAPTPSDGGVFDTFLGALGLDAKAGT